MPRTPKPPTQRRHRGGGSWVKLASGVEVNVPRAPDGLGSHGRRWWRTVWTSPMAVVYLPVDRLALERGARLVDALAVEPDAKLTAELRHLEDRFGLSPLARRRLMWEVDQASERAVAPPRRPRRDLRAVP